VLASDVFVDDLAGARHEAGDLIQAGIDWDEVRALASALGAQAVDSAIKRPVMFKSLGCAAWGSGRVQDRPGDARNRLRKEPAYSSWNSPCYLSYGDPRIISGLD
jgi:hypothetical protein